MLKEFLGVKMGKKVLMFLIIMVGAIVIRAREPEKNDLSTRVPTLIKSVQNKVTKTINSFGDHLVYPRFVSGTVQWHTQPIKSWTSGFFPGILWYTSELTNDKSFVKNAKKWTDGLNLVQYYPGSHDIGFMIYCSYGNGYRLTKNEEYKKVILQTAKTLITRFNSNAGCIRSWDHNKDKWQYPVIIDNMMNLELLFWASQNGGKNELYDIAFKHAETTMMNHFRPDGSTFHVVNYDTTNGNILSKNTHQGYKDESCWSRGQAWAIYGFTMAYRFTKDVRFLTTAQKAAQYYLKNLPTDLIPYWDFNAPNIPNEPRDASAAAIASSALFELSKYGDDSKLKYDYYNSAVEILNSLSSPSYFMDDSSLGIIGHAVGNKPSNSEVDVTIIYGDYYYLEALLRFRSDKFNNNSLGQSK